LFLIYFREYSDDEYESKLLIPKYQKMIILCEKMTNKSAIDRPHCEEILQNQDSWTINENEFEDNK
jgi:hypothetical protein